MRDKSMMWSVDALKQLAEVTPISGGGVFSHGLTRLYQLKKAAPGGTKIDPVMDAYFDNIPIPSSTPQSGTASNKGSKAPSIYDILSDSSDGLTSSEEEDITSLPLKTVIQKLYERIKIRDKKIRRARVRIEKLKNENIVIRQEFDSLKDVAERWLHERVSLYERIKELEAKIAEMKLDSTNRVGFLEGKIEKLQNEYDDLIRNQVKER